MASMTTYTAGVRYTTAEVAELYGVTPKAVRIWIRGGRLEALDIGTEGRKVYRITENQLEKFERATQVQKIT